MLEARLIAAGILAACMAGGVGFFASHERSIGAAKVTAAWDAERAARASAAITEEQRQIRVNADAAQEAQRLNNLSRAALDRANSVRQQLHDYSASSACAGSQTTTASGSNAASAPGDMHTRLLDGVTEAAIELATEANKRGIAGAACQHSNK